MSNWMLRSVKIRTLLMKSRIYLINWEMVAVLYMNLINNAVDWRLKKRSFKVLWRKLRVLLNKKRIRCLELNLNLDKLDKKLIEKSKKKWKNLKILEKIISVQWILCRLP